MVFRLDFSNLDNFRARLKSKLKSCETELVRYNSQPTATYLHSMISLPSTELVKWAHIVSIAQTQCVIHRVHFSANISHNSLNAAHLYGFTVHSPVYALLFFLFRDKFPFSIARQFFCVSVCAYSMLRLRLKLYIYIWSVAAMPFSKPQLELIQLFRDFKTNATIVYQAKKKCWKSGE